MRLMRDPVVREFLLAFWKIHILHHAEEGGVYGQWMLEELHHHGYRISPGTLYPMLSRMAARGWLRAAKPKRATAARVYRLTPQGAQNPRTHPPIAGRALRRSRRLEAPQVAPVVDSRRAGT